MMWKDIMSSPGVAHVNNFRSDLWLPGNLSHMNMLDTKRGKNTFYVNKKVTVKAEKSCTSQHPFRDTDIVKL